MAEDSTRVRPARTQPRRDDERACLEVIVGRERAKTYWLEASAVIGRGSTVDIALPDDGVSRRHAKIVIVDDVVTIKDLGSTNGTLVNGAPIDTTVLRTGDRIQIGPDVTLRFDYQRPGEREVAAAAPPIELSAREHEIVLLVADGLTNPEIAARLHISRHTVVSHLSNVFERTLVKTRAGLAKLVADGRIRARS